MQNKEYAYKAYKQYLDNYNSYTIELEDCILDVSMTMKISELTTILNSIGLEITKKQLLKEFKKRNIKYKINA